MIGTGGQAAAQLEAMLAARKLEEVKIFDLNEERCKAFAEEMQKGLAKYGAKIIPAKDSDDCIEDADLIIMSPISMSWIRQFYREHLRSSVIQKRRHFQKRGIF